jgi:hypothetical protein
MDRICPSGPGRIGGMKELLRMEVRVEPIVARFGEAILVKTSERRFELRGGSSTDGIEAREWISLFLPDVVVGWRTSPRHPRN